MLESQESGDGPSHYLPGGGGARDYAEGMKSRVHPKYKTKCHVQNWTFYDHTLIRRDDVTIWLSPDAIGTWEPVGEGS